MNGIVMGIVLIGGVIIGVSAAAKRGHRMPMGVCITALIIGCILVATPTVAVFLLRLCAHGGSLAEDETMPCWSLGGILALVGLVASFFCERPAASSPPGSSEPDKLK